MRVFVGIAPPKETISKIEKTIGDLKKKFPNVGWEIPEKVHLTLVFFGFIDRERVGELRKTLQNFTAGEKNFNLKIGNLSYFYKRKENSIISFEIEDELRELREFYRKLKLKLEEFGFSPPERLTPHLTIGRVKRARFIHDVKRTLVEILETKIEPLGEFEVNSIGLFESTYSKEHNTSQYRLIESFPLLPRE